MDTSLNGDETSVGKGEDAPLPWERQPGEGSKAFEAASIYFQLGADRSLRTAARKCEKQASLLGRWSEQWRWVERARAYDAHMARIQQEASEREAALKAKLWEERRQSIRDREWDAAEKMMKLAENSLNEMVKYNQDFPLRDVFALLQKGTALARQAVAISEPPPAPDRKGGRPRDEPDDDRGDETGAEMARPSPGDGGIRRSEEDDAPPPLGTLQASTGEAETADPPGGLQDARTDR